MKKLIYLSLVCLLACFGCDNGKKAEQARLAEQARQDSIAAVKKADSIAKAKADSIELAELKAKKALSRAADSATIAKLEPKFRTTDKSFLNSSGVVYTPKSAPTAKGVEAIYMTFRRYEDRASELTLHYQITNLKDEADKIEEATFDVDGKPYTVGGWVEQTQDLANNMRWYEFGESTSLENDFLDALLNAKSVKVNFKSPNAEVKRTLNSRQIEALKNTIVLYRACGG